VTELDAVGDRDGPDNAERVAHSERLLSPIAVTFVAMPWSAIFRLYAASTNPANSGCGRSGFDLNSGWNWTARYHGCPGSSTISTNFPSSDRPTTRRP